jgi:hypothetical protein
MADKIVTKHGARVVGNDHHPFRMGQRPRIEAKHLNDSGMRDLQNVSAKNRKEVAGRLNMIRTFIILWSGFLMGFFVGLCFERNRCIDIIRRWHDNDSHILGLIEKEIEGLTK